MDENLETNFDKVLLNHNKKRKIINNPGDSDWGQLIIPGKNESPNKNKEGLKLLIMASYRTGLLLLKTLITFEEKYPNKLNIIGLITDDPLSPHARISMKRRIWRLFSDNEKFEIEDAVVETALNAGIPCYTGSVKTDYARKLLHQWSPDAIQVYVFGQIIDEPFINFPEYGIYNYHPADLLHHLGAGPRPFQDLIDRNASTSLFTIHQLSLQLDAGHILGQSPVINVKFKNGEVPQNLLIIEDKMTEPIDTMAIVLTHQLIINKESDSEKRIKKLDFASYFSKEQKKELLEPIPSNKHCENMPEESEFAVNLLDTLWE